MAYPIRAAMASGLFDIVHVSSDDLSIRKIGAAFGADVSFERPASLSDDHTGILPVAQWVLNQFQGIGRSFDAVFILFPCAPFLTAGDLRGAEAVFSAHGGRKNLLSIARCPVPAQWLFERRDTGELNPLVPGGAFIRSQDLPVAYFETGTFTIFSSEFLLSGANLENDMNYVGYELPTWKAIDIDTEAELDEARARYVLRKADLDAENSS